MTAPTTHRHRPTLLSTYSEPRTGPYAKPPRCTEHPRRTRGCAACRRYQNWTTRRHRLAQSQGEPLTVPVAEVREHLHRLRDAGMILREISEAANVAQDTICGILYKASTRFVCRDNARRLLAVPVPAKKPGPPQSNLVPAVGTIRRVRALARLGWTFAHIIAAGGSAIHRLDQLKNQEWVTERFAAAVHTAYEALSMTPGPSKYTAGRAARAGWAPPLAWDDDTIDDPDAQPVDSTRADVIDEVAVHRALNGERVPLTTAERDRVIAVGIERGMTAAELARRLHISGSRALELAHRVRTTQAA